MNMRKLMGLARLAVRTTTLLAFVGGTIVDVKQAGAQTFDCSNVDVPRAECEALVALYNNTGGPTWTDNTGWLQTNAVCSWFGVNCDAGYVSVLWLPDNNLTGPLPTADWINLPYLTELWLYENHLTGEIPTELGSLGNLTRLVLYTNQLSGGIPSELGELSQLRLLSLFDNQLSGNIPVALANLPELRNLDLGTNQLSGSIPVELRNRAALKYLYLNDNQLSGGIPPQLGQLQQLLELGLSGNQLNGSIPSELGALAQLTNLALGRNQLSGAIPPALGNLTNLQSLSLPSNKLTGNMPSELGQLTSLVHLALDSNELSGEIPPSIKNLTGLTSLSLSCGLTSNDQTVIDFIRARSPDWPSGSCRFLSGTVRDAAGNPITGTRIDITVALEDPEDPGLPSSDILEHACTDSNTGQYTLTDLPLGQLLFVFAGDVQGCDPYNTYGREYWNHHNRPWLSDAITLTPTEPNHRGIDFTLGTGVPELEFLVFNFNNPILADPAVRQAIAHGTDRQAIVSQAWLPHGDFGMVQNSYVGENHWAKAPDSVLTLHPYDPNRARSILESAGWIDTDGDGIREKNGQRLSLLFKTTLRQSRQDTGHLFQQWMADMGLEIQLDFMNSDDLYRQLLARDFDLAEWTGFNSCSNIQDETCVPFRALYSTTYGNVGSYNNPAADAEFDAAQAATSREERLVHAIQHQIIISEDLPILPLFRRRPVVGVDVPAGSNVNVTPMAGVSVNFSGVTGSGVAGAIATGLNSGDLPGGLELLGGVYEVGTSAQFSTARACFTYDDTGLTAEQESHLGLFHEMDGDWVDITDAGYPHTANNQICGTVSSFSPFAILFPDVVVNTPPVPQLIRTSVQATASFTDSDAGDTHTASWDWGDGRSDNDMLVSGSVATASHTYTAAGVYTVTVTITDGAGAGATGTSPYLVIYDPDGGFVTGGGWINSQAGAYAANPALTGKATFGFVSKYQKGANAPSGNTEFQFKVASLNFSSTSYDWLVVAGAKAQYKGSGTINGSGTYAFMLTAVDGQVKGGGGVDKFRIKIWDKSTGGMVYDNQMGAGDAALPTTAIQGGSIVVHK